jgi:hypothetical protein
MEEILTFCYYQHDGQFGSGDFYIVNDLLGPKEVKERNRWFRCLAQEYDLPVFVVTETENRLQKHLVNEPSIMIGKETPLIATKEAIYWLLGRLKRSFDSICFTVGDDKEKNPEVWLDEFLRSFEWREDEGEDDEVEEDTHGEDENEENWEEEEDSEENEDEDEDEENNSPPSKKKRRLLFHQTKVFRCTICKTTMFSHLPSIRNHLYRKHKEHLTPIAWREIISTCLKTELKGCGARGMLCYKLFSICPLVIDNVWTGNRIVSFVKHGHENPKDDLRDTTTDQEAKLLDISLSVPWTSLFKTGLLHARLHHDLSDT